MITGILILVGGVVATLLLVLAFVAAVVAAEFRAARHSAGVASVPADARSRASGRAGALALDTNL